MSTIRRFEDLEAWKLAREITRDVYSIARVGEFAKDFGLKDQICRSSVSVMSNIAEGFERDGRKEFVNFLSIAKASTGEVRSQLYVALDQNYITKDQFEMISQKCLRAASIIAGLIKYLGAANVQGLKYR